MVVDIYGSKEMFVGEYRNLLADRLLTQLDFCPEKEIRNLELLKLRFGDTVLHNCEVMLKDISDSKRIDAHIHSDGQYTQGGELNSDFTLSLINALLHSNPLRKYAVFHFLAHSVVAILANLQE